MKPMGVAYGTGLARPCAAMKHERTFKITIAAGLVGALLAIASASSWADDNAEASPLALRKIMQDLGKHMQTITDGISRGDWALVATTAPLVADHPQPPLGSATAAG